MRTPKEKKPAAEPKTVKYDSLRALKIAKTRKTLPRGLFAFASENCVYFKMKGQADPVLTLSIKDYAKSCLKADGFKVTDG